MRLLEIIPDVGVVVFAFAAPQRGNVASCQDMLLLLQLHNIQRGFLIIFLCHSRVLRSLLDDYHFTFILALKAT